ncbi:MAG: transaldolase [Marinilabiliales bacterium]|nr:MAG: transaldolase [Marinilabiliales bacterium]
MELYLDSVNLDEIKEASKLGYLTGLTTTPTFMVRDGVQDIDARMLELAGYVNILQVEALGNTAEEILDEAQRLIGIGLDPQKTVFKIPISLEGTRACKMLVDKDLMVNLHLVYTVQQAYMGFAAGATYICPLVGRLQDQGHDALGLIYDCVDISRKYNYDSKIMFSSVRNVEHIRNALNIGVQTITVPWKILKKLTDNHFTEIGTNQFIEDTRIMTGRVSDAARRGDVKIDKSAKISDALLMMTKSKLGAVAVMDENDTVFRIFTDGDLRRLLNEKDGSVLDMQLHTLGSHSSVFVDANATLFEAKNLCKEKGVDNLIVMSGSEFIGLLDIQDLI